MVKVQGHGGCWCLGAQLYIAIYIKNSFACFSACMFLSGRSMLIFSYASIRYHFRWELEYAKKYVSQLSWNRMVTWTFEIFEIHFPLLHTGEFRNLVGTLLQLYHQGCHGCEMSYNTKGLPFEIYMTFSWLPSEIYMTFYPNILIIWSIQWDYSVYSEPVHNIKSTFDMRCMDEFD